MGEDSERTMASCGVRKRRIAGIVSHTPLTRFAKRRDSREPVLRVFNFHSVPPEFATAFDRQLEHLSRRFRFADPFELERLLADGPGGTSAAILSFDDGLANHAEIAAEILHERGLQAIFAIPATFPTVPEEQQDDWFVEHVYPVPTELHPRRERRSLTWEQARDLATAGHRICSHGHDHRILRASTPDAVTRREVIESRATLERELPGVRIDGFCWAGAVDPNADDADTLIRATYSYSLGNNAHRIHGSTSPYNVARINLEASWPPEVVDFQLSGAIDALFALRRTRGLARRLEAQR